MRRLLWVAVAAVALTACAPMPEAKHRWPNHRQDHDTALAALKQQNLDLAARVDKLEHAVDALRHQLKQKAEAPAAAATPAASPETTDPGSAPTSPP